MPGRLAFALAANPRIAMVENGLGLALRDGKGRFFCGFRQPDGQLAFGQYRQGEGAVVREQPQDFEKHHPVFLSLDDMKARQIGAAVFTDAYQANNLSGLSYARLHDCRYALAAKDLTALAPEPDGQADDILTYSAPGLASAAACERARDRGFVSVRREVGEKMRAVLGAVTRTLGLA
jgi:hypothetical protein